NAKKQAITRTEKRLMALKLYLEGMGFRGTGRVLGVSNVTALNWIRNFGESVKEYVTENMPNNIQEIDIAEIDEMWHFTVKKNARFGSGSQSIGSIKGIALLDSEEKRAATQNALLWSSFLWYYYFTRDYMLYCFSNPTILT
ncbi:MAG: IS1 family transposase, partial [Flavobacteriaceae bacterium]|nr:IS1 family transposase [Flavobacteriaceae bacterium]